MTRALYGGPQGGASMARQRAKMPLGVRSEQELESAAQLGATESPARGQADGGSCVKRRGVEVRMSMEDGGRTND